MRRAPKLSALAITLVLAASLSLQGAPSTLAATAADAAAAQKRAEDARRKAASATDSAQQLQAEAQAFDAEIDAARILLESIQPQKDAAVARADELRVQTRVLEENIAVKRIEIDAVQVRHDERKALLESKVNSLYRRGSGYLLEFILTSESIEDFISRTEYAQRILKSDNDAALALAEEQRMLEDAKADLDADLGELTVKKTEAEAVERELLELDARYADAVDDLESLQASKTAAMNKALSDAKRYATVAAAEDAEAKKILASLSGNTGSGVVSGGVFAWPVPSSGRISSGWGDTSGRTKPHNAIDIAAPSGSAVVAANPGRVIKAEYGWGGGYGNRIWIDHGQGVVTCYNHLLSGSFSVSVGAQVARGQRIASVGSSGYSTGPHLDFQVVINGAFVNPMNYL